MDCIREDSGPADWSKPSELSGNSEGGTEVGVKRSGILGVKGGNREEEVREGDMEGNSKEKVGADFFDCEVKEKDDKRGDERENYDNKAWKSQELAMSHFERVGIG